MNFHCIIDPAYNPQEYFPEFSCNKTHRVHVPADGIVLVDPIYLADVYNDKGKLAAYIRTQGTFIFDFGGDWSGPVWLENSCLILPTSSHYNSPPLPSERAVVLCDNIGCDSGSFVFLPVTPNLPDEVRCVIDVCLKDLNGVSLKIPPGTWEVKFDQFDAPRLNMIGLYRNIVVMRSNPGCINNEP